MLSTKPRSFLMYISVWQMATFYQNRETLLANCYTKPSLKYRFQLQKCDMSELCLLYSCSLCDLPPPKLGSITTYPFQLYYESIQLQLYLQNIISYRNLMINITLPSKQYTDLLINYMSQYLWWHDVNYYHDFVTLHGLIIVLCDSVPRKYLLFKPRKFIIVNIYYNCN